MRTTTVNANPISYDIAGEGPTLVLLSGWCQDHSLFDKLAGDLSGSYRVIRIDWRGHDADRTVTGDFGTDEQADDVIALLDELGVDTFVPVSTSHGGWPNIEVTDRLGPHRVPRAVVIDWIMVEAGEDFVANLRAIQDPQRWREGRQNLFDTWLGDSDNQAVVKHLDEEMASFDFDMWARSCRVIEDAYTTWGSPLERMASVQPHRPITHLYSQPSEPDYQQAQLDFSRAHPWFEPQRLRGRTHFPTLESPQLVAERIDAFVSQEQR